MKKYSIVIPTYNHCDDLLKPCVESIFKYTDMTNVELIIVANGCTDNTREYVTSLDDRAILIWSDEAIGYTAATNHGIRRATGEYVVLLNNDTELLPQVTNRWLDMLVEPFKDPTVGLAAPLQLHDDYSDWDVLIFFCVMVRRELFDKIGLLDEIYSPGGGEDIDFTIRANQAGYRSVEVTPTEFSREKSTNVGNVPIWHKDNKTFVEIPEYTNWIVKRNGLINAKRYNKNIRLNLGGGGVPHPGFLSVDLYDKRAHVKCDVTKLTDFDDNSVSEIIASHVFEHLNPYHSIAILEEWRRVLKPGGKLIMEMPNIEEVCKQFITANTGERYGLLNVIYGSVNTTGVGGPDNITSPHLFGWWPQSIQDHLYNAGYVDVTFGDELWAHPGPNFHVEAKKPGTLIIESPKGSIDRAKLYKQNYPVYKEIFEDNIYRIEESNIAGKTVIDIGANAGFFALRCTELNAKQIISVEAQPTIFKTELLPNVENYTQIKPIFAAVYNVPGLKLKIPMNGVNSVVSTEGEGEETTTITLENLVAPYPNEDLVLKMDCEGSEYPILLNASDELIRRFETIFIEIHNKDNKDYSEISIIHDRLTQAGFNKVHNEPIHVYWTNLQNPNDVQDGGIVASTEKWVRV